MIIKRLLPNARAWRLTKTTKQLRQFFDGLSGLEVDVKAFVDEVWADIFPETTRQLDEWETQFGLRFSSTLTEQERRDRLAATWAALGGQDPTYIQETLQANGFDVYVHEAWEPGTEPAPGDASPATYRSPVLYLSGALSAGAQCGEALVQCGEAFAECGNSIAPIGYVLVNKIDGVTYTVTADPATWPYYLYIGGETFPDLATVATSRRDEFEALCLKICPAQQWLGMLVEYS